MCGINGAYSLDRTNVVNQVLKMSKDLEHRGQEGCGIAVTCGDEVQREVTLGSVDTLKATVLNKKIKSHIAIGHTRYSTTGVSYDERNLQPILNPKHHYSAIAHNGNLVNPMESQKLLISWGVNLEGYGTSDTGIIAALFHYDGKDLKPHVKEAMHKYLKGAYSLLIMTRTKLIAARDPYGIRPLYMARRGNTIFFASEDSAFRLLGVKKDSIREVLPGEMIIIEKGKIIHKQILKPQKRAFCIFESIYFARPDSKFYGCEVVESRKALGRVAAQEFVRSNIDTIIKWQKKKKKVVISGLPDSGTPASEGFYEEFSKFYLSDYNQVFLKVRGTRTFLGPDASVRKRKVREKLVPLKSAIKGNIIIIIDDSIVRGNTSKKIVKILKQASALEVHFVSSCSKIKYPCFYGIDTATQEELIAANMTSDEICKFLNNESTTWSKISDMKKAISYSDNCCLACFTGEYPAGKPQAVPSKDMLEKGVI